MASSTSFTYNQLIAELQLVLEEASAEYVTDLPVIVSLGESRLNTDLNFEIFDVVITGALTANVFVQGIKPGNWQGTRTLHLRDSGGGGLRRFLERRTYEYCLDFEPDESATAEPQYFAEYSPTEFFMTPAPDVTYAFELRQIQAPDQLTVSNQNTWLGDNCGDLLLYACLISSEEFLKSDQGEIAVWKATYSEMMPARKLEARQQWRSDYSPVKEAARTVSLT